MKHPVLSLVVAGLALVLVSCGPKPGTPEFVLEKIEQGLVVGGTNLKLLTEQHFEAMVRIIEKPDSPRMARQQLIEHLTRMELGNAVERLGRFLGHPDPELRVRLANWLGQHPESPLTTRLLLDRLKVERAEIVRLNLLAALLRVSAQLREPDAELAGEVLALAKDAKRPAERQDWIVMLGGFPQAEVTAYLASLLDDPKPLMQKLAAKSLISPAARPFDDLLPVVRGMLAHANGEVRFAALQGLQIATSPGRIGPSNTCGPRPTLALLTAMPDLREVLDRHEGSPSVTEPEKTTIAAIRKCLAELSGEADAGADEPPPTDDAPGPGPAAFQLPNAL